MEHSVALGPSRGELCSSLVIDSPGEEEILLDTCVDFGGITSWCLSTEVSLQSICNTCSLVQFFRGPFNTPTEGASA